MRNALRSGDVPVFGVLCFVGAEWPLLGGSFSVRGVEVLWPKKLESVISRNGPLGELDIARVFGRLAGGFPRSSTAGMERRRAGRQHV